MASDLTNGKQFLKNPTGAKAKDFSIKPQPPKHPSKWGEFIIAFKKLLYKFWKFIVGIGVIIGIVVGCLRIYDRVYKQEYNPVENSTNITEQNNTSVLPDSTTVPKNDSIPH